VEGGVGGGCQDEKCGSRLRIQQPNHGKTEKINTVKEYAQRLEVLQFSQARWQSNQRFLITAMMSNPCNSFAATDLLIKPSRQYSISASEDS
jgi:hypothetical protein